MIIDENKSSEVAPLSTESQTPAQPNGNGNAPGAAPNPAIERASSAAVDQHLSETAPKKRGPKPRGVRQYPALGAGGTSQGQIPGDKNGAEAAEEVAVEFNEKDAKAYSELILDLLSDLKVTIVKTVAKHSGVSDAALKEINEETAGIGERQRSNLLVASVGVARKYSKQMRYAPETALSLGIVGVIASTVSQCKTVAKKSTP